MLTTAAGRGGGERRGRGVSRQAADAWRLRRATATHAHQQPVHRPISLTHAHTTAVQSDADLYSQMDIALPTSIRVSNATF